MPSTVYKGDLAEVTFGHETGIVLEHGKPTNLVFTGANNGDGTSTITLSGDPGFATTLTSDSVAAQLKYPKNMLVGARVRFIGNASSSKYALDDYANTGNVYTIVENVGTTIKVTPELKGNTSGTVGASGANDEMIIDSFGVPTIDTVEDNMTYNSNAATSKESILTDQFLGLAGTVTLPETKADIKRYHVVGLGRDVAVQAPGKFTYEGGSFEIAMHSARWLYYALGGLVTLPTQRLSTSAITVSGRTTATALSPGDTRIELSDTVSGCNMVDGSGAPAVGDYVWIKEVEGTSGANLLPLISHTSVDFSAIAAAGSDPARYFGHTIEATGVLVDEGSNFALGSSSPLTVDTVDATTKFSIGDTVYDSAGNEVLVVKTVSATSITFDGTTTRALSNNDNLYRSLPYEAFNEIHDDAGSRFDAALKHEMRRITAIDANHIYLDDPLSFAHDSGKVVYFFDYEETGEGAPAFVTTAGSFGQLTNPVHHVMFTNSELPSFCLETSIRKRDVGSYSQEDSAGAPDSATDTGQLTRVFRGCKVGSFTISADTDAALKMTVGFNAAHCYTDTGRLEASNPGDRFSAHRMFENTANTDVARLESGIGVKTQKPFFFYNGSVSVAGKSVAQVTNFSLTGNTGVTHVHTIGNSPVTTNVNTTSGLSLDQVPFGGSRNPSIAVAGKATYDLSMEIITDDPTFFHHMRATDEFNTRTGTSKDGIKLSFTKQGSKNPRERMTILIDEYYIAEAPLPIPEDKGMIRSALKIVPQTIKVISTDTIFHY